MLWISSRSYWFGLASHFLLLGGVFTLIACQGPPAQVAPPAKAFSEGRKLTYQVTQVTPGSQQAQLDTMVLTSFGPSLNWGVDTFRTAHFALITRQTKLGYSYDAHAAPHDFSGVIEHDSLLWLHPPREEAYSILELSPFPYIQLPAKTGHRWTWDLMVNEKWGNPKWATWQGNIQVRSQYEVVGQRELRTPLGSLPCWLVRAHASSSVGNSSLDLWYHPAYGFVQLDYRTLNGTRFIFKLVAESLEHPAKPLPLPNSLLFVPLMSARSG
ncbi:hypothetical protein [Hymenobacter guriensis]|uniref:Uncharacterized protein n=1 Tax=Hymenobacter guriensis TaxID=2793065 RepID=A0ABS0L4U3_9BACT|nr:hypothetical protein [Hymenobacter guriensis]MBG8555094.1 hypothetical protein [Hymenobacter guriensis]